MAKIGFLGLGKMGVGMAERLISGGHELTVWNRSEGRAQALVDLGAQVARTPAEAANKADAVFSMVADDEASTRCWLADDGALTTMTDGALIIECSTISHEHTKKLTSAAAEHGLYYIDCPVNGGPPAAKSGELILLVGAEKSNFERARPLLDLISSSILHFGDVGTGTAFKLINNLLGAVHIASIAEAVLLANKIGLDIDTVVAAVESGPCGSPHVKRMIRPMLENRPSDIFGLAIGLREKDSRYCLAMAKAMGSGMAVCEQAYAWYEKSAVTDGAEDDSLLIKIVTESNGRRS